MEEWHCLSCHALFIPANHRQKYCSDRCRYRTYRRATRIKRQMAGKCPQCGGPHDYPLGAYKPRVSYCSKCVKKFHDYYTKRKEMNRDADPEDRQSGI